jgi:hypothetical protein
MDPHAETPAEHIGTLRARMMNTFRRAPDGLDPDDVYAYIVRLQARIDFLEAHVRDASNPAILDAALRQAADIRRQALEGAERAWSEIVHAADAEVARRRDEASQSARRLLAEACAEILVVHDRLRTSLSNDKSGPSLFRTGEDSPPSRTAFDRRTGPVPAGDDVPTTSPSALINGSRPDAGDAEPPFHLPAWIRE